MGAVSDALNRYVDGAGSLEQLLDAIRRMQPVDDERPGGLDLAGQYDAPVSDYDEVESAWHDGLLSNEDYARCEAAANPNPDGSDGPILTYTRDDD